MQLEQERTADHITSTKHNVSLKQILTFKNETLFFASTWSCITTSKFIHG